jgi:nitronate monooxygenase
MPAAPERSYNSNTAIAAKKWMDVWSAGQGVGAIHAVQPVAAVVDQIEAEFKAAQARFALWRASLQRPPTRVPA